MVHIYILLCSKNKFYVGKTHDVETRFKEHCEGKGSSWTVLFPPVKMLNTFEGDHFDEDKTVKIYMSKYGINNVRGGSYTNSVLSSGEIKCLTKEIRGAFDSCTGCGSDKHWGKECTVIKPMDDLDSLKEKPSKSSEILVLNCLYCCGKKHTIEFCSIKHNHLQVKNMSSDEYIPSDLKDIDEKKDIIERRIYDKESFQCSYCKDIGHMIKFCKKKRMDDEKAKNLQQVTCIKCNGKGHYANRCTVKGKPRKPVICLKCGVEGHYANKCIKKDKKEDKKEPRVNNKSIVCLKCGIKGHYANSCDFEKTPVIIL